MNEIEAHLSLSWDVGTASYLKFEKSQNFLVHITNNLVLKHKKFSFLLCVFKSVKAGRDEFVPKLQYPETVSNQSTKCQQLVPLV